MHKYTLLLLNIYIYISHWKEKGIYPYIQLYRDRSNPFYLATFFFFSFFKPTVSSSLSIHIQPTMSYEKPIRKPQVPPGLDEFEPNRLHAGLNDLQAAKGAHRLVYTHPSEDVDKLNSTDRVRRNKVAREHGRLPALTIKKEFNNNGLQEADPLSSFVTAQPIKRSWMNAKGEEYILQTSINDNESRRVFPIPRKHINKRFKEKLQLEQYTIEQKEISMNEKNEINENIVKEIINDYSIDNINKHRFIDGDENGTEFLVNDVVLSKWGKTWMMAKIIELGNDKIKINYFGKNKEDDRWVDDSNDKLKKQVLILDRHKAEERRGAFPKLGDGVLVRVVPAKDANIYTAFGTGLLGTCIKCLPQNDCSVVKIEPNLLLKEGFIGTFANGWLSIRYKDHFAQEKCNFIHSTIRCLKEEEEEE